jgi:aquaporin Z
VIPYIIAQVAGAIVAAAVLYAIASGKPDWVAGGFASNGFGDLSPGKYGLVSCLLSEVIATFFFLYVIIGTTSKGAAVGFAGIPIGLCLTLIHLFLIPVTNASVNPARSTGPRCSLAAHISASSGFSGLRRASARLLQDSSAGGSTIWLTPHRRDP